MKRLLTPVFVALLILGCTTAGKTPPPDPTTLTNAAAKMIAGWLVNPATTIDAADLYYDDRQERLVTPSLWSNSDGLGASLELHISPAMHAAAPGPVEIIGPATRWQFRSTNNKSLEVPATVADLHDALRSSMSWCEHRVAYTDGLPIRLSDGTELKVVAAVSVAPNSAGKSGAQLFAAKGAACPFLCVLVAEAMKDKKDRCETSPARDCTLTVSVLGISQDFAGECDCLSTIGGAAPTGLPPICGCNVLIP